MGTDMVQPLPAAVSRHAHRLYDYKNAGHSDSPVAAGFMPPVFKGVNSQNRKNVV